MTYHINKIPRGEYGKSSKILEEVMELIDSEQQDAKIMSLNELSDIIGAVKGYMKKNFSYLTLYDLIKMAEITESAFIDGERQ